MKVDSGAARCAVDFVILPPDHVMDIAISLNSGVCDMSRIVLNKSQSFPHVSLLMGCLRVEDFKQAEFMLKTIASQHRAMPLKVRHFRTVKTGTGDILTLDIEPYNGLQILHQSLIDGCSQLLSKDAKEEDVFGDPPIASTLDWINNFIPNSCFENFWPHITIGYTDENALPEKIEPFTFTASRLAICHLGNYCTCKRILAEARLAD